MQHGATVAAKYSRGVDRFLGVDTQQEFSLLVGVKGRRNDAVGAGYQLVSTGDLTHVNELRRLGDRLVASEEVLIQRPAVRICQLHINRNTALYYCNSVIVNCFKRRLKSHFINSQRCSTQYSVLGTRTRSRVLVYCGTSHIGSALYTVYLFPYFLHSGQQPLNTVGNLVSNIRQPYFPAIRAPSVPASSSPIERVFSKGGLILRPHRAKMSDCRVSSLIFLKCNDILK